MEDKLEDNKEDMTSMVTVLNDLHAKGYTTQFKASEEGLCATGIDHPFKPEEVIIKHFYRFEGESNPDDSAVVYAIETKHGEKGTLIDSYGTYNDEYINKFVKEVEAIKK